MPGYEGDGFNCTSKSVLVWCAAALMPQPYTLADIDECARNTSGCEDVCTDTDGSFLCSCPNRAGFRLASDGLTCAGK